MKGGHSLLRGILFKAGEVERRRSLLVDGIHSSTLASSVEEVINLVD